MTSERQRVDEIDGVSAAMIVHFDEWDPSNTDPWVKGPPPLETLVIAPPNPAWSDLAELLAAQVISAVPGALSVQHIGSTSVAALAAKPVIDLDLIVPDSADEDSYVPALHERGWVLWVREPGWHEHRMVRLAEPRANLHVLGPTSPEPIRHRLFRDWLRAHPDDRALYEGAKRAAAEEIATMPQYTMRKQAVIRDIYDRAFRAAGLLP